MNEFIEQVSAESFDEWLRMGLDLWPENTVDELKECFLDIQRNEKEKAFLYRIDNEYVGFINISIRRDYVEGSSSSPVGYIEGVYVKASYRKNGIARRLVRKAEEWSRDMGCNQIGSDIELNNKVSYDFHRGIGFEEANRVICFIKDIE